MKGFAAVCKEFAFDAEQNIEELRKAVILSWFRGVILSTPVDTGALRGSWIITADAPETGKVVITDPAGADTIRKVEEFVNNMPSGVDTSTFLTNNLPYAYRIEFEGWSKVKAPRGMVRINFVRISNNLKKRVRFKKGDNV